MVYTVTRKNLLTECSMKEIKCTICRRAFEDYPANFLDQERVDEFHESGYHQRLGHWEGRWDDYLELQRSTYSRYITLAKRK